MSSSSLNIILINLYRFGGPILIVIGTISSVMNIILFIQKNNISQKQNSSFIYLIARNICNILFIYLSILYETLSFGYNITPSSSNIIYCRFSLYMTLVFDILSPFYLLLTLLDYILIRSFMKTTSHREREKRYYFSYIICMSGFVFWMLFHIHALFYSDIVEMKSDYFYCSFQVGFYARLMRYYSLVMKGIVIPLLFVIFGLWIMKNYRNTSRVMCISHLEIVESERKSKDREMIMILVKDIIVYIIFSSITSIIMIYELITEHHIKNVEEKEVEYSIRYVGMFCVSMSYCFGFYTNVCLSKRFRENVKSTVCCDVVE
ncbi:unnamed protein product [Adineta steineri]|uniref:G-protein coupled receptors family 1 profile domain-containing protein n=3 Tax=Adineta steineri TaxID=433720 RepID=A0A815S1D5_9BILA|nr:unnamed protein product [Adineta steineri]